MSGFLFISDHEVLIQYVEEAQPFTADELQQHLLYSPQTRITQDLNVTNATAIHVVPQYHVKEEFTYNWTQESSSRHWCDENDIGWYTDCTGYYYTVFHGPAYIFENSVSHTTTVIAEPHVMFIFGTMYTGLGTLMIALTIGETFSLSYWALTGRRDY